MSLNYLRMTYTICVESALSLQCSQHKCLTAVFLDSSTVLATKTLAAGGVSLFEFNHYLPVI